MFAVRNIVNYMKTRLFVSIVVAIMSFSVVSRANNCVVFTSEHELSSSMVNQVYQDLDGVIWVSTEDGLTSYDGAGFVIFRNNESDSLSLCNNYVRLTYEDSNNRFFVGTLAGLQLYDRATRQFKKIQPYIDGFVVSQGINVSSLVEANDGTLIVGTSGHGLFCLSSEEGGLRLVQNFEILPNCFYIEKLLRDSAGYIWIATLDNGVYVLDSSYRVVNHYDFDGNESCFSLLETADGCVYLGSSTGNLARYIRDENAFELVADKRRQLGAIADMNVEDSCSILLGTDGGGLKVFNTCTNEISDYNLNMLGFNSHKLKVHSVMRDNHKNLWLGCFQQGVLLEPVSENDFIYIGSRSSTTNNVGSCCIMSVTCDKNDNIWVGTDNDGIYLLNKDYSLKRHYSLDVPSNMVPRTALCVYKDSRGNVWVGSYLEGLSRLNPHTGKCTPFHFADNGNVKQATSVYDIVEDEHGNLWVAVSGVGIYRINLGTYEQKLYPAISNGIKCSPLANQLPNAWVNVMLLCKNKLYFGCYDGLGCLDIENDDFLSTFGKNRLLSGEVVHALHEDVDGKIWIGTSNGLFCYDPRTGANDRFTTSYGLPSNSISSIESDADGNLWISTNNGISCLIKQSYFFSNYYASDGLQCNEFSKSASCVNSQGTLFYGGVNGLISFNPQKIKKHYSIPKVIISNFYIHNNAVTKGMMSGNRQIVDCDITKADKVYLSYSDNSFSIEFTAMEYANPERIGYMYSLDGNGWIHMESGGNKVSFSNLKPGKHQFSVRSVDANSYSKERKLYIYIAAPWYASKLAYICYALLFVIIVVLVSMYLRYDYKMKQKIIEHKHAEDINEAKLQFFINISHEIRTPMTLIIGPLQKMLRSDSDPERQKNYGIMYRNADRILDLINQLMDIRKIDKGQMRLRFQEVDVVSMIRDICIDFEYQSAQQKIKLNCVHDNPQIPVWVDYRNFDKIIVNILSNAFKFTPANGEINIKITEGADAKAKKTPLANYVQIDIEDSGTGIDSDDLTRIFERFYQSRGALNMSVSGTGVGLHLTKSLVELHHGTITAANNDGKPGCHFTIRLPKGAEHLSSNDIATPEEIETLAVERASFVEKKEMVKDVQDEQQSKVKSKTKFHVLLAEDDEEIRKYIKEELSSDFHVQECANGQDAWTSILRNAPDIVVSDVMMPLMDGKTLCQKIKQNITVNYVPVVLLTALSTENDKIAGLDVGADAYITKPFNIEVLRHTVQNIIKSRMTLKNKYQGNQSQEEKLEKIEMETPDDRLMQRVMKVINANISNPKLSVEMVANNVGISRVHLHRKLRELTNQATSDFIRNVRLQQAATLLSEKHHCIAEVASIVGFPNPAYFSTAFKDLFGVTPYEYMSQQQNSNKPAVEKAEQDDIAPEKSE